MKILCVTNMYPSDKYPYLGIFVQEQIECLRKKGVEIDVFVIKGYENKWNYFKAIAQLRKLLDAKRKTQDAKYSLIHAFYGLSGAVARRSSSACLPVRQGVPPAPIFMSGTQSGRASSLPLVITFCGSDIYKWWQRLISRWAAKRAQAVIVRSPQMAELLGQKNAEIIPSGVDLELFRPGSQSETRVKLNWSPEKQYVIFVGDPDRPEKQFHLAQKVIKQVCECNKNFDIELIPVFNKSFKQMPLYYNAADALILTSRWEGSPNAVKEALACGCPVVAVDVGDVGAWVKGVEGCFVCRPDISALSQSLTAVLRDKKRIDYRLRLKELDILSITDRIIKIYQKVVDI